MLQKSNIIHLATGLLVTLLVTCNSAIAVSISKSEQSEYISDFQLANKELTYQTLVATIDSTEFFPKTNSIAPIEINRSDSTTTSEDLVEFELIAQLTNPASQPSATSSTPSVAIIANDTSIIEGTAASFDVTRTGGDLTSSLKIELSITQMGNFIHGTAPTFMTIPANQIAWDLSVPTEGDTMDEENGKVIVTIDTNARYTFNQTYMSPNRAEITVMDDDLPKVSIFASDQSIVEGTMASFDVLRVSSDLSDSLRIELSITQLGSFIQGTTPTFVIIPANRTAWDFNVQTKDDMVDEANGKIIATIITNARYEFNQSLSSPNRAESIVTDNDEPPPGVMPSLSISGQSDFTITEGESVSISVISSLGIEAPVTVNLNIDEGTSDFIPPSQLTRVTLQSFQTSVPFIVQTVKDNLTESTGTVSVTITTGTNYDIAASPNNTYSFDVTNNTGTPQLYITPVSQSVKESQSAQFEIAALINFREVALATDLPVAFSVETTGDFFDEVSRTSHTFVKDNKKSILSIPTMEDTTYEADGSIKVTLNSGIGYELHNILPNSATIQVFDNDNPTQGVSVVAIKSEITEGEYARFQITRPSVSENSIRIRINVSEDSNFIFGTPVEEVIIKEAQRAMIFEIETINNTVDEENGLITLRILEDENVPAVYIKSTTRNWASVEVVDNDEPTTSTLPIASVTLISPSSIEEGDDITIQFNATKIITESFKLKVSITERVQSGNGRVRFLGIRPNDDNSPHYQIEFPKGVSSFRYNIPTENDVIHELDGIITIRLLNDTDTEEKYNVDNTAKVVTISVSDNEELPTISIKLISEKSITEGDSIAFRIESDILSTQSVFFSYNDGPSDFFHSEMPEELSCQFYEADYFGGIVLPDGEHSVDLCILTNDDNIDETDGEITINLRTTTLTEYNLGTTSSIAIPVLDNDKPTISISTTNSNNTKSEGEDFEFNFSSSILSTRALPVQLNIKETGDFIESGTESLPAGIQTINLSFENSTEIMQTISTEDDSIAEAHGTIRVTVLESAEYNLASSNSITYSVTDNDLPNSGISIFKVEDSVPEGGIASFQIHAGSAILSPHIVRFSVSDPSNFIDQTNPNYPYNEITMRSGRTYEILEIKTSSTNTSLTSDQIIVSLATPTDGTYSLANSNTQATITINKIIPNLKISPNTIQVTEGYDFNFSINSSPSPVRDLTLNINSAPSSPTITYNPSTFSIATGNRSKQWTATAGEVTSASTISLSLGASSNNQYQLGTNATLAVTILDNDNPTNSYPRISIAPNSEFPIRAGSPASYNINVEPPVANQLNINIDVTQIGKLVSNPTSITTIQIPAYTANHQFDIATRHPDNTDDNTGTLTVTLKDGTGVSGQNYALAAIPNNTANVSIVDEMKPTLSIQAAERIASVNEGEIVSFHIVADSPVSYKYPIEFFVQETGGSFLTDESKRMKSVSSGNGIIHRLNLATKPVSNTIQPDGIVSVTIVNTEHYQITRDHLASVVVHDINSLGSGFSILTFSDSITEGEDASFLIRSDTTSFRQRSVSITISDGNKASFIGSKSRNLVIERLTRSSYLTIETIDFANYTADGFITVTINESSNYDVLNTHKIATIKVVSNDTTPNLPRVSISSNQSVTEGTAITLYFTVTSSSQSYSFPSAGLSILINVQQSIGNFLHSSFKIGDRTITLNSTSESFEIPTQVVKGQGNGQVNVVIKNDPNSDNQYLPANYPNALTQIIVQDNGLATPSVSLSSDTIPGTNNPIEMVTEGDNPSVIFQLDQPARYGFILHYSLTESGSFLQIDAGVKQKNINIHNQDIRVQINTVDDDDYELDGTITVEILDGVSYEFNLNRYRVEFSIINNDPAPISVAASTTVTSIVEDGSFNVTFTATSAPGAGNKLTILVAIVDTGTVAGYFKSYSPNPIEITGSNTSTNITIETNGDDIYKENGEITARVLDGIGYDSTGEPVKVEIINDDPKIVNITASSTTTSVVEGQSFSIMLIATEAPGVGQKFSITLSVEDTGIGTGYFKSYSPNPIEISGTNTQTNVTIATNGDTDYEQDGELTIQVVDGIGYQGLGNSVVVQVTDDDPAPITVSATTNATNVVENSSFEVTLTASQVPGSGNVLTILLSIEDTGTITGYFKDYTPNPIRIRGSENSKNITVQTNDNDDFEGTGEITVRVLDGIGYDATGTPIQVTVIDDEPDPNRPVISITYQDGPNQTEIIHIEGQEINLLLSSNKPVSENLEINVTISQEGNYLREDPNNQTYQLVSGEIKLPLTIETQHDTTDEDNGSITVQIMAKISYTVATKPNDKVQIIMQDDDDPPILSINDAAVAENSNELTFILTLSEYSEKEISIQYQVFERTATTEDYSTNQSVAIISAKNQKGLIQIMIIDDSIPEEIEEFEITLNQPVNARFASKNDSMSAIGKIVDDESDQILVSIDKIHSEIIAGEVAKFTLTAIPEFEDQILEINLKISQLNRNILWRVPQSFEMSHYDVELNLQTIASSLPEPDGRLQVEILPGENYEIDQNMAEVMVIDNINDSEGVEPDIAVASAVVAALLNTLPSLNSEHRSPNHESITIPELSISVDTNTIDEGRTAIFLVNSSQSVAKKISVPIVVNQNGNFIANAVPSIIQIEPNQLQAQIEIPTRVDGIHGENGSISIRLLDSEEYTLGDSHIATLKILDTEFNAAQLVRFQSWSREVVPELISSHEIEFYNAFSERRTRIGQASNSKNLSVQSFNTLQSLITRSGELTNNDSLNWRNLLADSSFQINLTEGNNQPYSLNLWGSASTQEFNFDQLESSGEDYWSGDMYSGFIAIDSQFGNDLFTGLAIASSDSKVNVESLGNEFETYKTQFSGIQPYLSWNSPDDKFHLSTIIGLGQSRTETNNALLDEQSFYGNYQTIALDLDKNIYSTNHPNSQLFDSLNIFSQSAFTRHSLDKNSIYPFQIQHYKGFSKLYSAGEKNYPILDDLYLNHVLRVGMHADLQINNWTLRTNVESEVELGLARGLNLNLNSNFYFGEAYSLDQWSLQGALEFNHSTQGVGLTMKLSSSLSEIKNKTSASLVSERRFTTLTPTSQIHDAPILQYQLGYGLEMGHQYILVNPFGGFHLHQNSDSDINFGTEFTLGNNYTFEIETSREINVDDPINQKINFNGRFTW